MCPLRNPFCHVFFMFIAYIPINIVMGWHQVGFRLFFIAQWGWNPVFSHPLRLKRLSYAYLQFSDFHNFMVCDHKPHESSQPDSLATYITFCSFGTVLIVWSYPIALINKWPGKKMRFGWLIIPCHWVTVPDLFAFGNRNVAWIHLH